MLVYYDSDGEWIHQGLLMGTLCLVHDRSYMEDVTEEVCSVGVQIYCTATRQRLRCGVAEKSEAADNYRGEILGAVILQLILRATTSRKHLPYKDVTIFCDNKGVLGHGNSPKGPLLERQSQADLL